MNNEKATVAAGSIANQHQSIFLTLPRKRPTFRLVDNQAARKKVFNARRSRSRLASSGNNIRSPSLLCSHTGRQKTFSQNSSQTSIEQKVNLLRILGITELSNRSFALNNETGTIAYAAGASIVNCDPSKNEQTFLINRCRKAITCLAFSPDGKHMASGERGHNPKVRIWDLVNNKEIVDFAGHRYSIDCVCFSPNLRFVVSVGVIHDMSINVWNWKIKIRVSSNNICSQIAGVAFSEDGSSFVTVGNRHVKFWYLSASISNQTTALRGRSGILAEKKNNSYCDVACGKGDIAGRTFAITTSSLLCEFSEDRILEKWVDLKTDRATCLSVGELYIMVGCGQGIVRIFDTDMQFMLNMPLPSPIGTVPSCQTLAIDNKLPKHFADAVCLRLDEERSKVFIAYNDHSWYHFDISDILDIKQNDCSLSHGGCIWSLTVSKIY
ncbi:hypothetical protein GJ496_010494 [Pomphorhynchus laevis]|nr:hypothetical protein GJ496_010494 [Pomphorhynchus laevis]